jgi:hypothetical protein
VTLTPVNYFKNATLIGDLMTRPVPSHLGKIAARFQESQK